MIADMEALQAAVCEDDPAEQQNLLALIGRSGIPTLCSVFSSGEAFLASFQPGKYDLILMDIYMGGLSGVETVAEVRKTDESVPIAFATTSVDFTLESYRLGVLKYIEKPAGEKAVRELLELALLKRDSRPRLFLKIEGVDVGVPFERILYVEQQAHGLLVHLTGGELLHATERLDALEPRFEGRGFFRCHKSFLVNLAYVRSFDRELMVFTIQGGENVYIRRESLAEARRAYESYLFRQARGTDRE